MLLPFLFGVGLPLSLASSHTFYNEVDVGPLKSSPHKPRFWPQSYPPPLPLWALGPQSPYKPRRRFVPYFGPSWSSSSTTTTTSTTTERPYVPFSTCSHLPAYCSSYFGAHPDKPLPTQAREILIIWDEFSNVVQTFIFNQYTTTQAKKLKSDFYSELRQSLMLEPLH